MTDRFSVERIDALRIVGPDELADKELMSPCVWRLATGKLGILVRVVSGSSDGEIATSTIWYGESDDGLSFTMDNLPVLVPGPDALDAKGCEDPTVVLDGDGMIVFYTGVDRDGGGHLLWASGPDVHSLIKRGVALGSFDGEENVKEAEIEVIDGGWTMGYEYARDEASLIGLAVGDGPSGPWREIKGGGFAPRPGSWDAWHLSPGPLLLSDPNRPIMFYNGATRDAEWSIGWIMFDYPSKGVVERCDNPVIGPPGKDRGRNMAFAASLLDRDAHVDLYFTYNDRDLRRATLTRHDLDAAADQRFTGALLVSRSRP